jgi:hypothetical protein
VLYLLAAAAAGASASVADPWAVLFKWLGKMRSCTPYSSRVSLTETVFRVSGGLPCPMLSYPLWKKIEEEFSTAHSKRNILY